jgi:hypothetical protein
LLVLTCNQPDRDEPRIKCGYPLPCPHHTVVIDPIASTVTIPLAPETRLGQIARLVEGAVMPTARVRAARRKRGR